MQLLQQNSQDISEILTVTNRSIFLFLRQMRWFTETHARSVSERKIRQVVESSELAVVVKPTLWHEAWRVLKQSFVATDAVQIRLTVRLQRETRPVNTGQLCTWQQWLSSKKFHDEDVTVSVSDSTRNRSLLVCRFYSTVCCMMHFRNWRILCIQIWKIIFISFTWPPKEFPLYLWNCWIMFSD